MAIIELISEKHTDMLNASASSPAATLYAPVPSRDFEMAIDMPLPATEAGSHYRTLN